jgi:hypothetical protein
MITKENLIEKYPFLFARKKLGMELSCMHWGISVGDGWLTILDELSQELSEKCPDIQYEQIKEKFGHLRIYTHPYNKEAQEIINRYEQLSSKICEECGNPGKMNDKGWLKVTCDDCNKDK